MSGDLGLCLVWEAEMRERGLWREVERAKQILALQQAGGQAKRVIFVLINLLRSVNRC